MAFWINGKGNAMFFFCAMMALVSVCLVGVLSCRFQDTLWQRVGMSVIAIGAFGSAIHPTQNSLMLIAYGTTIYAVATAWKFYRAHHGKPA